MTVQLTRRQREVLDLSRQGLSIHEIADRLFIEVTTVKTHRVNIRRLGYHISHGRGCPLPTDLGRLQPRQAEICRLAQQGFSDQEIADIIGIACSTVRNALYEARRVAA